MKEKDVVNRIYGVIAKGCSRPRIDRIILCGCMLLPLSAVLAYSVINDGLHNGICVTLVLICLFAVLGVMIRSISLAVDIVMARRAVAILFSSNGEPLYRLIEQPRLPVDSVLRDPGVIFAMGHFLKRIGYDNEASEMIGIAIDANPKLKSVSVPETNLLLPEHDLHVVLEGLDAKAGRSRLLCMWTDIKVRKVMIGGVLGILALSWLVQLIKIFLRTR